MKTCVLGVVALSCVIGGCSSDDTPDSQASGGSAGYSVDAGGMDGIAGGAGADAQAPRDGGFIRCTVGEKSCSCMVASSAGAGDECSAASQNGVCCAAGTYPSAGYCSCMPWMCSDDTSGSCSCHSLKASGGARCTGSYAMCCMRIAGNATTCTCKNGITACDADSTQVSNCDIDLVGCSETYGRRDSCSE